MIEAKQISNKAKKQLGIWYEVKCRKLSSKMWHSSFIYKENHVFIEEEDNPTDKLIKVEEEHDGIGNLVKLPSLMFIGEECGDLQEVVDGWELTRNNNKM